MAKKLSYSNFFSYLCTVKQRYMIDEKAIQKLLRDYARERDENVRNSERISALTRCADELTATMHEMKEKYETAQMTLMKTVVDLTRKNENLEQRIVELEAENKGLREMVRQHRGKRFASTSEQASLLNNRTPNGRDDEKERFDGKGVESGSSDATSGSADSGEKAKKERKGKASRRSLYAQEPDGPSHVDETITHRLSDYYQLPEGARFMKKDGEVVIYYYTRIEYLPARVIKHVYEVASVITADDEVVQTMETPHVAGRCPFNAAMLAFILTEKYAYHTPINVIKKKLRNAGAVFTKSALNRYFQLGMQALSDLLRDTLYEEVRKDKYLMVDETPELVGIYDKEKDERHYRKKYLWAFFAKLRNLVAYVYEKGSRGRDVVTGFLQNFCGFITTDGYTAYSIFEDEEKYPDITRTGCWAHARRLFIEALETQRAECTHIIDLIGELFALELKAKILGMDETERQLMRATESVPIMERLRSYIQVLSENTVMMANPLMKKAVGYALNQWEALRSYIKCGCVEISNNLCEQRMKPIKLLLKNCLNVGSEAAAERAAFIHSLIESCNLNHIDPWQYLQDIFQRILTGAVGEKKMLLPCFWRSKC